VLPRISQRLIPGGHLILVDRTLAEPLPWEPELRALIQEYSTYRHYVPYDIVIELQSRDLITVSGRAQTETVMYSQSIDGYVESFHSRNVFSRARLRAARAREFNDKLWTLLGRYGDNGTVCLPVRARIVWGRPSFQACSA
jgi:hypothetical protein